MSKPITFCMEDFQEFLLDNVPQEHADYVFGLMSLAKQHIAAENQWREILEND